jgi:hypothetical protein
LGRDVKSVHIIVGIASIVLMAGAGLFGAWLWWRATTSVWFWRILRAGQLVVLLEAAIGGVPELQHHTTSAIHIIYGLLPIAVSFIGEQLRISSAETILDARGFESAAEVGELPEDEQRGVVAAIVQRETGVMTLAALVIVVLLARAAGTS